MSTKAYNPNDTDLSAARVSIGMPVYNGELHIRQAIDSILAQTFRDFELIICDNASTDCTGEICQEYAAQDRRIRYYRNAENLGLVKNFNRAFELSRGEFFKWHAHDDILAPTYLQRCVETFEQNPSSVVLCFPQRILMTYEGNVLGQGNFRRWYEASPPYHRISFARLMRVPGRRFPGLFFGLARRNTWARTQLVRPVCYNDLILVTELKLLGEFREIPEPLFLNRIHNAWKNERRTVTGELQFYDPGRKHRTRTRVGALMVLLMSRLGAVRRSQLPALRKAMCMSWVLIGHIVIHGMSLLEMPANWCQHTIQRTWESLSIRLLNRSKGNLWFHRLWVFLAGFRHSDRGLVGLAFSPPSKMTRDRLIAYISDRLRLRQDAQSRQLLAEWTSQNSEEGRQVAEVRSRAKQSQCERRGGRVRR